MTQFVVVGAGPAGCSAALRAARLPDVQVKIIEKRSFESMSAATNNPRSYPMVLTGRSLRLFEELEVDLPCTREPYHGIEMLPSHGTMKSPNPKRCALVSRSQLALNLLYEAASHPSISIHFGASPISLDTANKSIGIERTSGHAEHSSLIMQHFMHARNGSSSSSATVSEAAVMEAGAESATATMVAPAAAADTEVAPADDEIPGKMMSSTKMAGMKTALALQAKLGEAGERLPETLEYDFLVGADGALSKVRELLKDDGTLDAREVFTKTTSGYKTFTDIEIPEAAKLDSCDFPPAKPGIDNNQHLWFIAPEDKALNMRIVMWRSDSDHVCGMVPGQKAGCLHEKLTPAWMRAKYGDRLPEWFLQPFCDQLNDSDVNGWGAIREVSQFHGPGVVLLGDSAHAVTSSLGQGCNTALESVRVFGDVLEEHVGTAEGEEEFRDGLEKVPEEFTARRERDARALQRMELLNSVVQSKGEGTKMDLPTEIHARVAMGAALLFGLAQWKLMPQKYETHPLFALIQDENVPYSEVLAYVNRFGAVAYGVMAALFSAIGFNLAQVLIAL